MTNPTTIHCDVCVVGAGSGGFGAAVAAARHGAHVVLLEAGKGVGGTSTWAGVNNYEPVAGATGLPWEVYRALRQVDKAAALQRPRARYHPERPWGWYDCSPESDYRLSLSRRSGLPIAFEPEALDQVMRAMIEEAGTCDLHLETPFTQVATDGRRLTGLSTQGPSGPVQISAASYIDATANIYLAQAAGCQTAIGPEGPETYDEPGASNEGGLVLNNSSLCYRIARLQQGEKPQQQPLPPGFDLQSIRPVTSIRTYPNGDLNMNPLGLMTGAETHALGDDAYAEALVRTRAHWHMLQTQYQFDQWKLVWLSPRLGVRESHRLVGRYVLKEQDLVAGLAAQDHADIIALADHSIDFHGARPSREVPNGPYGIPFRCLQTSEFDNLLVACRGASFSSIGASSCRLSRTMMVLGQAAGTAAALAKGDFDRLDMSELRQTLTDDGVALDLASGYLDAMADIEPLPERGFVEGLPHQSGSSEQS
ncbi:MAG: FAD-dependent oxidoreductase [Candidatus Latescibacteria bacterium]|nr:FAD-dependent oxidoreductase [Candidatus Latescibacterota bacterium]